MGVAPLNDLKDRLHTAAIAGINVIGEDFRLRRALEQFEPLAASAPVLGKVAGQVKPLLSPDCPDKTAQLLNAMTLLDAVVCTQADFRVEGEITPIETMGDKDFVPCRYSELSPLLDALTSKGSGRYEIIDSARREGSPALRDYRLQSALVAALGDSYGEMADLVQRILETRGQKLLPLLKYRFDPNGGREMIRRLQLMEKIAGGGENDFYLRLTEEANAPIKEEAIHALRFVEENDEKLIELTATERGAAKKMALVVLGRLSTPAAEAYWVKELEKGSAALQYLTLNGSDAVSDLVAKRFSALLGELLQLPAGAKVDDAAAKELCALACAIPNKCSDSLLVLLQLIAENARLLSSLKTTKGEGILAACSAACGEQTGDMDFMAVVNDRLLAGMNFSRRPELIEKIEGLCSRTGALYLTAGLAGGLMRGAKDTYDTYSRWIDDPGGAKAVLRCFYRMTARGRAYCFTSRVEELSGSPDWLVKPFSKTLDTRWITALTREKRNPFHQFLDSSPFAPMSGYHGKSGVIAGLINPSDEENLALLRDYFCRRAKQGKNMADFYALASCGWKDFAGMIPAFLKNQKRFEFYTMTRLYASVEMDLETRVKELYEIADMIERGAIRSEYKNEQQRVRDLAGRMKETADR